MFGPACNQFAFLGVVEAMLDDDDDKNRLCRPIVSRENDVEYLAAMTVERSAARYPELARWMKTTRLSPTSGLDACIDDPTVIDARAQLRQHAPAAAENLHRFLATTG